MRRTLTLIWLFSFSIFTLGQNLPPAPQEYSVDYDGSPWHLKGEGIVCCPCSVPCPCRTNDKASYGHCESALYLHVRQGHYAAANLDGMRLVNFGGACAMSYEHLAALYFDRSTTNEQRLAFLKIMASFLPRQAADFPYVRVVDINAQVTDGHLYHIAIPGILQMIVDRNWGRAAPPAPMFAGVDYFSNTLQYAQNLRYVVRDVDAKLDFDYSQRQANFRDVDLDAQQYQSKLMLIQFQDGKGWFNEEQLRLIRELHLQLPDLAATRRLVARLRQPAQQP